MDNLDEILAGCRRKERKSQEELYRRFYPVLFALCRNFFKDEHDILSAINNGMIKIFNNLDQYDPARGQFFNWAYATVRNAALTLLRDKKVNCFDYEEITENMYFEAKENPFQMLAYMDIEVYLSQLPMATRRICSLFYMDGFSVKEIAKAVNISEGTVKWHLSESRTKLKIIFGKSL